MLTKFEIDAQYYKLYKHFINKNNYSFNSSESKNLFALISHKERLVAVSYNASVIIALSKFDKYHQLGLWFTTMNNDYPNINVVYNQCWKYQVSKTKKNWEENLNFESIEELHSCILDNQKVSALELVYNKIEGQRLTHINNTPTQQTIYISKYLEAKEILEKNVELDTHLNYPYTTGYANNSGLTLQEAAKAICLKHEFQSGLFAETENLRIKYKNLISSENELSNLKEIIDDFSKECNVYGNL